MPHLRPFFVLSFLLVRPAATRQAADEAKLAVSQYQRNAAAGYYAIQLDRGGTLDLVLGTVPDRTEGVTHLPPSLVPQLR